MRPSQDYLNMVAKKLDAMRKIDVGGRVQPEGFKLPSFEDQVGQAAMEYLKNKKDPPVERDPLFPDRNTY